MQICMFTQYNICSVAKFHTDMVGHFYCTCTMMYYVHVTLKVLITACAAQESSLTTNYIFIRTHVQKNRYEYTRLKSHYIIAHREEEEKSHISIYAQSARGQLLTQSLNIAL